MNRVTFPGKREAGVDPGILTVILAGGYGTRVAHLLPSVPKPMASISGRPFVEWVVKFFNACGLTRFVLSTGHLGDVIESHFQYHPIQGVEVLCRREMSPLGTGGGFLNAIADAAPGTRGFLVANGDSMVVADPTVLARNANANGWDAAVLGLEAPDASRYGSLQVAPDQTLRAFAEKHFGAGLINAGVYWFASECVAQFPDKRPLSFELDVFPGLLAKGARIGVLAASSPFIDIGTPASLAEAEIFIREHLLQFLECRLCGLNGAS
jgi:D-glycero-alpha-D-manno-heptose 1-phosphate guanylyltransferase